MNKGDKVYFGRSNGEKTLGEIVKVNRKTYKVKTLEVRGAQKVRGAGVVWKVPHSLCTPATEARPARNTRVEPPVESLPKRTEAEVLRDIDGVYCSLSPENLTCDGELSRSAVRRKAAGLRARLKRLFRELGREVTEDECYRRLAG